MKNITALLPLIVILLAACGAAPETAVPSVAPMSCDLLASSETVQVFKFSDPDTAAPVGVECVSLGGGVFECTPDACLMLPYTGTCPHCAGGGE